MSFQVEFSLPMIQEWNNRSSVGDTTAIHEIVQNEKIHDDECIAADPVK